MKFLLNVLATLVGLFIFVVIFVVLMLGAVATTAIKQSSPINDNAVLKLDLNRTIVERTVDDPFAGLFGQYEAPVGLIGLKEAIKSAKEDQKIKGIYLDAGLTSAGFATLEEIRDELINFKESGKFIISYSEIMTEGGYYLASVADEIYLPPDYSLVEFNGLSAELIFLKGTFDKLGIEPEIFRVGEFKSAAEPFILTQMSEENREQTSAYVNSLYNHYLRQVADARGIDIAELTTISDSMLVQDGNDARRYKLISGLAYYDTVLDTLRGKLGVEDKKEINFVSLDRYRESLDEDDEDSDNQVAVIVATGNIVTGEGDNNMIGSEKFASEIRKARLNDDIKAVVLRINSGGGSALASDIIWREVQRTKEVKPIIASMSDVAASGGYFIAMGCDTIVAQPNTITGSIGVIMIAFNAENFLEDKLGITTDRVKTGEYSDILSPTHPLSESERKIIQKGVNDAYETFVSKAANDRNMPLEELKKVASGRVWSGIDGKERNLVDVLGGLDDAVEIAAEAAGIKDNYAVNYYPEQKTFIEELLKNLETQMESKALKTRLGPLWPYAKPLEELKELHGIQARLPFDIIIK